MEMAANLAKKSGLEATSGDGKIHLKGGLHPLLTAAISDALSMYHNNSAEVGARYAGADGKAVMKGWWQLFNNMVKPLQKKGMTEEASVVAITNIKAVEASYNFFGITPLQVKDNIPLVAGFLIFYVLYTLWYGFAIFELFEGIGLTMKKAAKAEV
jgi:hypothetical protein